MSNPLLRQSRVAGIAGIADLGVAGVVALGIGVAVAACSEAPPPISNDGAQSAAPVTTEALDPRTTRFTIARFEGGFDATTGTFEVHTLDPTPADVGFRQQALGFCNDFRINVGSADFRLDTVAGSLHARPTDCIPPDELSAWRSLVYDEGGALCATVRASSRLSVPVTDVVAEMLEITANYEGYQHTVVEAGEPPCCGTGADLTPYRNQPHAPTDLSGGAFLHGDLAPGQYRDTQWTFRNAGGSYRFSGRIAARLVELANGRDDDCDGRIDNALHLYADGDPCIEDSDCESSICDSDTDTCRADCEPGRFGASCEECPGGAATPCNGNGRCDEGPYGTGECSCTGSSAGLACESCLSDSWGADCTPCPNCGANGFCNAGPDGDGTCVCAPGHFGDLCEFTECPQACINGGTCITSGVNAGTCSCPSGLSGAACDIGCPPSRLLEAPASSGVSGMWICGGPARDAFIVPDPVEGYAFVGGPYVLRGHADSAGVARETLTGSDTLGDGSTRTYSLR
ncbi:MAG: hypothetical protein H6698_04420 [Myxococcales bacterium]|nr:hypothetical protein [Myxococcales bacterium]MCB9520251.1 hypothetical protein [Myxococcales bacterium]MCB9531381.1 hypothetical protein [Myxococcales bacterium]MCB9533546.1 hypothetical protein [Myxococcales bacterium]